MNLKQAEEEFIKKVYNSLREKLGQQNHVVQAKSM